jgi:hypothetical protein
MPYGSSDLSKWYVYWYNSMAKYDIYVPKLNKTNPNVIERSYKSEIDKEYKE